MSKPSSLAGSRQVAPILAAMVCGSIKPLFSGTDDYHERLVAALADHGANPVIVDIGDWRLARAARLFAAVAAARPDVILLQYPTDAFGRSLTPQLFAALQRIAPLVVTVHEFTAAHRVRRLALLPLLARARGIVMTAEREVAGLLSWYPWVQRRVRVIPVGNTFPPLPWAPATPPSVVYFGQIRPNKGLEDFIACRDRLVAPLAELQPAPRFEIIGSRVPQFSAYHDEIAAAAAARGIALRGGLDEAAVSQALAAATCALLPFPDGASLRRTSLLAAAACGTPIATLGGIDTPPELARLLRLAGSPEELAAATRAVLADPAVRQDAHERSLRLAAHVGWEAIAERHLALFSAVVAGGTRDGV